MHYATERQAQRDRLHAALLAGAVPSTLAIDDDAAVLLGDAGVERVVCWQPQATAQLIAMRGGTVEEHTYSAERIVSLHS